MARLLNLRPELVIAVATFLIASTAFGVVAFRNYSALAVVLVQVMLALAPLFAILWTTSDGVHMQEPVTRSTAARAVAGGLALAFLQATSLVAGFDSFPNFAYERLEVGSGYHVDTAFHVAIIQNILTNGRPSTGQHLQPFLAYHWLSHYFDAAIVRLFAFDAWESYSLLYYAKATPIVLAFMHVIERATRGRSATLFWGTLAVTFPAFSAGWYVTLSHSQWVPVLLLLLAGPWLADVMVAKNIGVRNLLQLSALFVALTLGKGSIGLALAVVFGVATVLRRNLSPQVVATLGVWVLGLVWWGSLAGVGSSRPLDLQLHRPTSVLYFALDQLEYSLPLILSIFGMATLLWSLRRFLKGALFGAATLGLASVTIGTVSIFGSWSSSDAYYYWLGLCYVGLVVFLPTFVGTPIGANAPRAAHITVALARVLSPWAAPAQISPYQSITSIAASVLALNDVTYRWHNESNGPEDRVTLWRLVSGNSTSTHIDGPDVSSLEALRDKLNTTLRDMDLPRSGALLLIPSEGFADLSSAYPGSKSWSAGLLVSAITGMVLVHGVSPDAPATRYGFSSYSTSGDAARWMSGKDAELSELCDFGRPVLVVHDIALSVIETSCSTE